LVKTELEDKTEVGDRIWSKQKWETRFGQIRTLRQDLVKIELGEKIWSKQK